jgi:type IV pilus assembly protein PilA
MRDRRADDRGFTLIELLVVVVIIGVLVAIAIPVYLNYTKGAANKATQSDVRNAVITVEQCYADNANTYPADAASAAPGDDLTFAVCTGVANVSPGVKLTYDFTAGAAGTPGTYTIKGENTGGNKIYTYSSTTGKTVAS